MKAFMKTLVGDSRNLTVVGCLVLAEVALVYAGHAGATAFVMPPLTLGGVAWLAKN